MFCSKLLILLHSFDGSILTNLKKPSNYTSPPPVQQIIASLYYGPICFIS